MRKTLCMAAFLMTLVIVPQLVSAQTTAPNQISLDAFVNSLIYDKQSRNFGYDYDKQVTFPSYYLDDVRLVWYADDSVAVYGTLQFQFDAVNKVFPTTDGQTVTMEKFRVLLRLAPKPVPFDEVPALIKKYEILFKFGSPVFEIAAEPDGMNWSPSGKYPPGTYEHFYIFLLIQSPTEQELEQLAKDIFFVATEDELNTALRQKAALRGLALSYAFYSGLTDKKKKEVKELIQHIKDVHYRPIFIYGQPLNEVATKELLGKDTSGCNPPFFGGILPTKRGDNSEALINMCGADSKQRSEEWLRNYINNYWKETKEDLKKRGTAVLD